MVAFSSRLCAVVKVGALLLTMLALTSDLAICQVDAIAMSDELHRAMAANTVMDLLKAGDDAVEKGKPIDALKAYDAARFLLTLAAGPDPSARLKSLVSANSGSASILNAAILLNQFYKCERARYAATDAIIRDMDSKQRSAVRVADVLAYCRALQKAPGSAGVLAKALEIYPEAGDLKKVPEWQIAMLSRLAPALREAVARKGREAAIEQQTLDALVALGATPPLPAPASEATAAGQWIVRFSNHLGARLRIRSNGPYSIDRTVSDGETVEMELGTKGYRSVEFVQLVIFAFTDTGGREREFCGYAQVAAGTLATWRITPATFEWR